MPARTPDTVPWEKVNTDFIGPWTVKTPSKTCKLHAATMIDPATGWFEMCEIPDKSAHTVMNVFDKECLCHCPCLKHVGMDGGAEFLADFKETMKNHGCKRKPTTPFNPQGNSVVERIHQFIGDAQ